VAARKASAKSVSLDLCAGQVFLLGGEIVLLYELKSSKCRVLTLNGTLKSLRVSNLCGPFGLSFPLSPTRDELQQQLASLFEKVENVVNEFSLPDLWELLVPEGNSDYSGEDLSTMWLGESSPVTEIALAKKIRKDKVYFTEHSLQYKIRNEDAVSMILKQRKAEEEKILLTEQVVLWFQQNSTIGTQVAALSELPDFIIPVVQSMKESVINEAHISARSLPGKVLSALELSHDDGAFALLVDLGIFSFDENLLLSRFAVSGEFSSECIDESVRIEEKVQSEPQLFYDRFREEVSAPVFTIDDFDTTDRDDGLSFEEFDDGKMIVGVHITDVSAFICEGSILDKEAFKRTASIYLPDIKVPMLPKNLSAGALSLGEGERKRCVSVFWELSPDFKVVDTRCALTWVNVRKCYTYEEVLALLETDTVLGRMRKFADTLFNRRMAKGGIESKREFEMKVIVDNDGNISTWKLAKKCPARTLVSELMIITNNVIAGTLNDSNIPAIYRKQLEVVSGAFGQDSFESPKSDMGTTNSVETGEQKNIGEPGEQINIGEPGETVDPDGDLKETAELIESVEVKKEVGYRPMNKVQVSTDPGPHSSLGVSPYTQATSPVRRYSDLLVQRQLAAFLSGVEEEPVYTTLELESFIDGTAYIRDGIKQIERWGVRYWLLKYLLSRKEDVFQGEIVEKRRAFYIVELSDFLVKGRLYPSPGNSYCTGDRIDVSLTRLEPREGFVRLKESRY